MEIEDTPQQKPDLKTIPARKGCPAVLSQASHAADQAERQKSRNKSQDRADADFVPGSD